MENIILKVSGKPNLSFHGVLVAEARNAAKGLTKRVFETAKGHWMIAEIDDNDILFNYIVIDNKSTEELVKKLGFDSVAKSIYSQLKIDTTDKLDI